MQFNFNMGYDNFAFNMSMLTLHIEVKLGNAIIQSDDIQGPFEIIRHHCKEMVGEVAHSEQPMKITISGTKDIELPNGDWTTKPQRLIFANNAYLANFNIDE